MTSRRRELDAYRRARCPYLENFLGNFYNGAAICSSADLPRIDAPVLIVYGAEDRVPPSESTSPRRPALVKDARLIPVEGRTAQHRVDPP